MNNRLSNLTGLNLAKDPWLSEVSDMQAFFVTGDASDPTVMATDLEESQRIFVTSRMPLSKITEVRCLVKRGFSIIDTALSFQWEPSGAAYHPNIDNGHQKPLDLRIRRAHTNEADAVGLLAEKAFTKSRFQLDPDFPDEVGSVIKREWARNLTIGQRGDECLVAVAGQNILGFLGICKRGSVTPEYVIDLIAVDPDLQREGVGMLLVRHLLNKASRDSRIVSVGTQAANVAAVRFYETLGFRYVGAEHVLHAHV